MGMRPIYMKCQLFIDHNSREVERSRIALLAIAQGLCKVNELWLIYYPNTPRLYDTDVRYHIEEDTKKHKDDEWCDIPTVLEAGWGDCDDLACYLVAERRVFDGADAEPFIKWSFDGSRYTYHMLVTSPQYGVEDPSKVLGMGSPEATIPLCDYEAAIKKRRKKMGVQWMGSK